jgi:hypothetical protein
VRFRSHMYGLVGFVKQLVDEAGMGDITHPAWGTPPARASKFKYIRISHGQVIIAKADALTQSPAESGQPAPLPRRRRRPPAGGGRIPPGTRGKRKRP